MCKTERSSVSRRLFLRTSGMTFLAGVLTPGVVLRAAAAAESRGRKTVVILFQRGAVDGLNVVIPYTDARYYEARPSIAIGRPGTGSDAAIDLDGRFGLHPALRSLMPHWKDGSLAFVHEAGSPHASRSHFDAQDFMETGTPGEKSTRDGFLARAGHQSSASSPLRSVAISDAAPRIFSGSREAVTMPSLDRFALRSGRRESIPAAFEAMYTSDQTLSAAAGESFDAMRLLERTSAASLRPANGAVYPRGAAGDRLRQIAQLIRADVGLEIAFTDIGGWDTHANQGGGEGQLARLLSSLGEAMAAFARDLGSRMNDVVVVTMSEFGRTVRENGNRGTDHGHGNVMMLLGGAVRGGRVAGHWSGLDERHLFEGRDLQVTTDFRAVMSEILSKQCKIGNLDAVFPRFDAAGREPGLLG